MFVKKQGYETTVNAVWTACVLSIPPAYRPSKPGGDQAGGQLLMLPLGTHTHTYSTVSTEIYETISGSSTVSLWSFSRGGQIWRKWFQDVTKVFLMSSVSNLQSIYNNRCYIALFAALILFLISIQTQAVSEIRWHIFGSIILGLILQWNHSVLVIYMDRPECHIFT